jgi:hypothetical protein
MMREQPTMQYLHGGFAFFDRCRPIVTTLVLVVGGQTHIDEAQHGSPTRQHTDFKQRNAD